MIILFKIKVNKQKQCEGQHKQSKTNRESEYGGILIR